MEEGVKVGGVQVPPFGEEGPKDPAQVAADALGGKVINEEFSPEFVPKANWMAFKKVGDHIKGTFVGTFFKESRDPDMPNQQVYELTNCAVVIDGAEVKAPSDEVWRVGIKEGNSYVLDRAKKVRRGQRMGFKFEKEIPTKKQPAKSIQVYLWQMDPTFEDMPDESAE